MKVSIKKNYLYNTFYQILSMLTPLITAPYASRIFDPDGIGIQSYTSSVSTYFVLFAVLGTGTYGQREIAKNKNNKEKYSQIFWEIVILRCITSAASMVAWFGWILLCGKYQAYFIVLTTSLIAVIFDISWFYTGLEQFGRIVLRNTIVKVIGIASLFIFVRKKEDLLLYITISVLANLGGNVSMWSYLPLFLQKGVHKRLEVKKHLRPTLIYFVPAIASSVYSVLDKTMIEHLTDNIRENGYYEQTAKIISLGQAVIISYNTVMMSRMTFLFAEHQMTELKEKLEKAVSVIMILSVPLTLGVISVADSFVPWFFGDGYEPVINILYINSFLFIITGLSNCMIAQYLLPSGRQSECNKVIIVGAIINFFLNLFLIPSLGGRGAAIASVTAEMIILVAYLYLAKEFISIKGILRKSYKQLIAGMVMWIVLESAEMFFDHSFCLMAIQVIIGCMIYLVGLIIMREEILTGYLDYLKRKILCFNGNH